MKLIDKFNDLKRWARMLVVMVTLLAVVVVAHVYIGLTVALLWGVLVFVCVGILVTVSQFVVGVIENL